MDSNSKVKAGIVKSETYRMGDKKAEARKRDDKWDVVAGDRQPRFTMASDRLANASLHHKNYPIPGMSERFKLDWRMGYSDLYYPAARLEDGSISPLFIDLPVTESEIQKCKLKLAVMKELKIRYTYIVAGQDENIAREILDSQSGKKH